MKKSTVTNTDTKEFAHLTVAAAGPELKLQFTQLVRAGSRVDSSARRRRGLLGRKAIAFLGGWRLPGCLGLRSSADVTHNKKGELVRTSYRPRLVAASVFNRRQKVVKLGEVFVVGGAHARSDLPFREPVWVHMFEQLAQAM